MDSLGAGQKGEIHLLIEFTKAGEGLTFPYRLSYQNELTSSHHNLKRKDSVTVHLTQDSIVANENQKTPNPKKIGSYSDWEPNFSITGTKSDELVDYLSKHRESYLKYPENESVGKYIYKKEYNFPLYFELPQDPRDILTAWGLPEGIRGKVELSSDREKH